MRKLTILLLFLVSMAQAQTNIEKVEYWIDSDPGFDLATPLSITSQPDLHYNFIIPANLSLGIHTFGIRSKDANGIWSHTNFYSVNIVDSSNGEIVQVEYFWDTDPGFGNGNDSIINPSITDISNGLFIDSVPISFLQNSYHILFERSRDSRGRWSHTNHVISPDSLLVCCTVDVNELSAQSGINMYPNPFSNTITVTPQTSESFRLILYDEKGIKVIDKLIDHEIQIDTHPFACGIYTVYVLTTKNKIYQSKIIKQ